ncbi:MAG: IclR family transcriptional regulator, partial [Burkholderiales bacterium]
HICRDDKPIGVSALAGKLRLTKSNAHRVLRTLVELGYVQQHENGNYGPTLKAWELGNLLISRLDFVQVAKPYLKQLNERTGESIYLATLNGTSVVYLDVLESSYPIRINASIGGTAPPHCSASGKLLLAFNPGFAKSYLSRPLEKHTARTTTKLIDVQKTLEAVRKNGYAVNDGEWREGVCGVSAPIHTPYREGIAAIGITALKERTNRRKLTGFAELLRETASRISRELGYRPALHAQSRAESTADV